MTIPDPNLNNYIHIILAIYIYTYGSRGTIDQVGTMQVASLKSGFVATAVAYSTAPLNEMAVF